ncbi:PREDICTED: small integral membrane protein 20 [Nicrophorus vespilloides]|uniref:Small integral membrane protein 20 n=1 Tax=Nicrophorus vespilloides TaxID=110193 RepID=A0ABM1MFW1_NICVS|nr:PREDICTED: small integral membrane protein 20 [Nicrophorus vespilloides]
MARWTGWRYGALIGGIVSAIGITIYPIVIYPMTHIEDYKELQKHTRRGIRQEEVQPGNMKVWSDPFDRNKSN